ncbi:transcriptional-regulating factor 1-like [Papaver somniferum]|uniref:transcriptional-regulating factor 1-like n=1 Tax=Papaver somniferum TaxID=3469 RepID=UPI000E6FE4DD|nr:transcriptional-regulating factor 1-like [Papaver somniferum]
MKPHFRFLNSMGYMSFSATPPPTAPNPPPPPLPPPPDIMPEASSNISSLVGKKLALISISPPSTASTPKRRYQQISEDNEMAVDTPPPKVIKISGWDVVCGCKVNYSIDRIESECFRVSDGKTTSTIFQGAY